MFIAKYTRWIWHFSKMTPEVYLRAKQQFQRNPQVSVFGEYFIADNLVEIFNLVRESQVGGNQKIQSYQEIQSNLCTNSTDLEFNILANIHRQKSMLYLKKNELSEAISEIEKALKAIEAMEMPFQIELAALNESAAQLYLRDSKLKKAERHLLVAKHSLDIAKNQLQTFKLETSEQFAENQQKLINSMEASVYSSLCLICLSSVRFHEAREYLAKSLLKWDLIENKNTLGYLFTIKYKCMLHRAFKESTSAMHTAFKYLSEHEETEVTNVHRMWFMKFLIDGGDETYKQELKQMINKLSKLMPEDQLSQLLIQLEVIRKPAKSKPSKPEI